MAILSLLIESGTGYSLIWVRSSSSIDHIIDSQTTQNQLVFAICYAYLYSIGGTTSGTGVFPYVYDVISGGATVYLVVRLHRSSYKLYVDNAATGNVPDARRRACQY